MTMSSQAKDIADKWGPALTKAIKDGDISVFKDLFVTEPVVVVLQNAEGMESVLLAVDQYHGKIPGKISKRPTVKNVLVRFIF
jgi:hypothetical protein